MKIILNNWSKIIFILSVFAISNALIAQYLFNLLPCKMCLYQRYPYYFIIFILIFFYFLNKNRSIWLFIYIEVAIFYGIFYSFWHVGIEKKFLQGPSECSTTLSISNSLEDTKKNILEQDIVNCEEVSWFIFGMSAATINFLFLVALLFFNTIFIYRLVYERKKN